MIKLKKKQEDERATMEIFFPKCRNKHAKSECPINVIEFCGICALEHATDKCPSLPGLQAIYKGNVETNDFSQTNKKPSWRSPNQNMFRAVYFQGYGKNQPWSFQTCYPPWFNPQSKNTPWNQYWRGKSLWKQLSAPKPILSSIPKHA